MNARFTSTAIAFHWIIGIAILVNIALALLHDAVGETLSRQLIGTHMSIGLTVLGLSALRLLWRWTHRPPPLLPDHKPWEAKLAFTTHYALYFLMFAMPLTGWLFTSASRGGSPSDYFGLFAIPDMVPFADAAARKSLAGAGHTAHVIGAYALYALVLMHLAGSAKHQLINRDGELSRMGIGKPREVQQV